MSLKVLLRKFVFALAVIFSLTASGLLYRASAQEIPLPSVPDNLRTPNERASYIARHFWDAFEFTDTIHSHDRAFIEQNFANFASLLPLIDESQMRQAFSNLITKAEADPKAFELLCDVIEIYLYETDSPVRNYEAFIVFLEEAIPSPILAASGAVRQRALLADVLTNRQGSPASDFSFVTPLGGISSLHSLINSLPPTCETLLLIFYDPDCPHCSEVMKSIKTDSHTNAQINAGKMAVLAIYSGDDKDLWQQTAAEMPSEWTVGYEPGEIQEKGTYILRTFPTLYLIGRDGIVIQKDYNPF